MENRSRVQEIRQRFENVKPQTCNDGKVQANKPPLAAKPDHLLTCNEQATKCVIKRSHAFRSDKSKVKLYPTTKDSHILEKTQSSHSNILEEKQFHSNILDKKQSSHSNILKKKQSSHTNILEKKRSAHGTSLGKLPPLKHNFPKSNITTSPPSLSESLRKALKEPLPCGPAPKKPPRTFAHNLEQTKKEPQKMELKGKVQNLVKETDKDRQTHLNNVSSKISNDTTHQLRPDKMSKDKVLAYIKNFENAIEKKKVQNNCQIYDSTHDTSDVSDNSNSAHVYSEPFSPHREDVPPKKITSLHYMSTAIENIKIENGDSPSLEYLIVPLNKESVEGRKEFDSALRKTRKLLISQAENDEFEEVNWENICHDHPQSPLADYCAMLPPTSNGNNAKNHDIFEEIKSLMIDAYNHGIVTYNGDGGQAQLKALRENASSKQLTEMFTQIVTDNDDRFRERRRVVRMKSIPSDKLIDALLLIGIDTQVDNGTKVPYIKKKYTQSNFVIPSNVERVVFPDAACWPPIATYSTTKQSNYYTIVLTKNNGERSFAYCRRLLPEGSLFCLPLTYVILTGNEDTRFYHKVLDQIEINHGLPESEYQKFINNLMECRLPQEGGLLELDDDIQIERFIDNRPYEYVISNLLTDISVPVFLKIFSAMLLERKIIVVSSHISKVCDSVEALNKCLFPFSWQHTIVSVLPLDMSEMLQSPTPYLAGVLKGKLQETTQLENIFSNIENSFVVDIDTGTVLKSIGDESTILPKRLIKSLKSSLYLCPVKCPDTYPSNVLLRLFIELVGHYPLVIINQPSWKGKAGFRVFLRNSFINALSSKSVEYFLRSFIDTAMFECFIRERLDNPDFKIGLFEKSCIEFIAAEVNKPSGLLKSITLNRTVKALGDQFLKEE